MLRTNTQKIVTTGLMLALGILLPFSTAHAFGLQGNILLPIHIPVFLCGFLCGPVYGGLLGFLLPFINCFLTGMPVFYPMAIMMSIELMVYAVSSGIIYKILKYPKKIFHIGISLVSSMILGRIAYGIIAIILLSFDEKLMDVSVVTATVTGLPGIIIQLIFIPPIVFSIHKFIQKRK